MIRGLSVIQTLTINGFVAINPNCRHPYKANLGIAHLKVAPDASSLRRVDRIGCHGVVVSQSSSRRSKEHCLYSCGSLVLHVWKNVSISIQRKGRARVSELLRNNFGRHSGCQRNGGRRMAQIIEPQSWDTRKIDY
jgi:hypothetical protein